MSLFENAVKVLNEELLHGIRKMYEGYLYDKAKADVTSSARATVTHASDGRVTDYRREQNPLVSDKLHTMIYNNMAWWYELRADEQLNYALADRDFLAKVSQVGIFQFLDKDGE